MGDLLGPGLETLSPALAGGFLTTAPPGKSQPLLLSTLFKCSYLTGTFLIMAIVILGCNFLENWQQFGRTLVTNGV